MGVLEDTTGSLTTQALLVTHTPLGGAHDPTMPASEASTECADG